MTSKTDRFFGPPCIMSVILFFSRHYFVKTYLYTDLLLLVVHFCSFAVRLTVFSLQQAKNNKKYISGWDRRTLQGDFNYHLNTRHGCNNIYHPYTQFPRNVRLSHRQVVTFRRITTIFIAHQHTDARYWYSNSVRLSVRLSICLSMAFPYWMKTA